MNSAISTNSWKALNITGSVDITAIQLEGDFGLLTIFNIYNSCSDSQTERALDRYLTAHRADVYGEGKHVLWCGDFNRHHPLWDNDTDDRLFTPAAMDASFRLIQLLAKWDMTMLLSKGILTLQHWATKKYSRLDNVFGTKDLIDLVIKCDTMPERRPVKTDHIPIAIILDITTAPAPTTLTRNFQMTDWEDFKKELNGRLNGAPTWNDIEGENEFNRQVETLTVILQNTIEAKVPLTKPNALSKWWWTRDLDKMKKEGNRLSRTSYNFRALPDHQSHKEYKDHRTRFADTIIKAKRQHWEDFLEGATEREMWIANEFIKEPVGDGGHPRIPTLKINTPEGPKEVLSNEDKAIAIAESFFPLKPPTSNIPKDF